MKPSREIRRTARRSAAGRCYWLRKAGMQARRLLKPMPPEAARRRTYHHGTYTRACIDALGGDAEASVHWLEETATHGMPIYPAFARDSCFDPIRGSARFIRFMNELKPVWDEVRAQDAIASRPRQPLQSVLCQRRHRKPCAGTDPRATKRAPHQRRGLHV